ncbi:hypothetical protein K432DRAFT_411468 [Lepidopterella palustris CBS 459.81]|uniref:Uncharacterized protein n=1 Tax=Lepidopterella palustris CBS 459.81 TaxID=1314670 RepID=A0A8E2DW45_9PEZI|nr:hypothetical protein K432DRAFT_411468 [Lepidopterella palustris CBS 459.81]
MPPLTPPSSSKYREHNTIKRCRFFNVYNTKENTTFLGEIARLPEINIPPLTANKKD